MIKESFIIQICTAFSILLLPFAHLKIVFFSFPLYVIEIPIIVACFIFFLGVKRKVYTVSASSFTPYLFFLGIGFFTSGTILSFLTNEVSLRGLGMIKTWFIMPILLLFIWIHIKPRKKDIDILFLLWFGVISLVSCIANTYIFQNLLTYDGRLSVWYHSPNYFAFFLAPGLLFAQYFFTHHLFSQRKWMKMLISFMALSLISSLFFSRSYTVWIAVFVSSIILFFFRCPSLTWKKIFLSFIFFSSLLILFVFFESGTEKWHSLTTFDNRSSFASRMMIWKSSLKMIADAPIFGIGIGRFEKVYLDYQVFFPPYLEWAVPQPHNLYLAILLQAGILGFLGFFLLSFFIFQYIYPLLYQSTSLYFRRQIALVLSLFFLVLIIGIVDTPFFKTDIVFYFWFILFLSVALLKSYNSEK